MGNSNQRLRQLINLFTESSDAFGKLIADGTNNKADLTSAFTYSTESYRLYEQGDRVDLRYGDGGAVFGDERDVYKLTPGGDNTLTYQTAKRMRYVVQYGAIWSQALQINRELEAGETIRIYFDGSRPTDNFLEDSHGLEVTENGAVMFLNRNGTRIREKELELARPLTGWTLFQIDFNWYGVGPYRFKQVYTDGKDRQQNDRIGQIAIEGDRPSRSPNGRITTEVETEGASDLEVEVGSSGFIVQGGAGVTPTVRQKSTIVDDVSHTGDGEYEPLFAFRVDPDNNLVTMQVERLLPTDFDTPLVLNVVAAEPDLTDVNPADFETAPEQSPQASAFQLTTNITEFPDNDGNQVTSAVAPGGYQIGFATSSVEGQGAGRREGAIGVERSRDLHDTDYGVVLARASAEDTFDVEIDTRQEW